MAGLLNPYADLNIDPDDTVQNIWDAEKKKRRILETQKPYSIWSAAKPRMAEASEKSYWALGDRNPILTKGMLEESKPVWSALEWFPGTGIGTKAVGMVGGVASTVLKSKAAMELVEKAKSLGITTQKGITEYVDPRLKKVYGTGQNMKTTRKLAGKYDPKTGEWVPYPGVNREAVLQNIDAIRMGGDPVRIKEKEDFLGALGVKLPDKSSSKYKDNLRMKYRYWSDDEWRIKILARNSSIKSEQAAARREMIEKSGTESLPEHLQRQMARDRVNSVVQNMRTREVDRGGSFYISDKELVKLKEQLFKIKLKEVKDGTPLIYRMTIDHHYPMIGKTGRSGEVIGSGLTSWSNITDSKGKLRLISMLDNIQKGETVPSMYQNMILKGGRWRKAPSIMSLK